MISKRGGVSKTISWFVAVIAVFCIMILFVAASIALAAKKEGPNEIGMSFNEGYFSLKSFLNSPVDGREGVFVKDLILHDPEFNLNHKLEGEHAEDYKLFIRLAGNFMDETFGGDKTYSNWLTLYGEAEEVHDEGKRGDYFRVSQKGGDSQLCRRGRDFTKIIVISVEGGRKLALCLKTKW